MPFNTLVRRAGAALAVAFLLACHAPASAQEPSAGAIATAREIITIKGGTKMYEPVVPGVIEQAKAMFLQTNPMLQKDLNEVAAQLRKDFESKRDDLVTQVARAYAARFTEQELKDMLTFYKSPLGKKMVTEEPTALSQSMERAQAWANQFSEQVIVRMRADMKKKGHEL